VTARIAVLASGGGSNLQALLDYIEGLGSAAPATVTLVVSDRAEAGALSRASMREIEGVHLPASKAESATALQRLLAQHGADHVILAGYLRLVPEPVVRAYRGRILNVHPALLPGFGGPGMYGMRVHRAVIESGAQISGATVHFVDEAYDRGPIVAQWPVPVLDGDDPQTLAARVLQAEHVLYPRAIHAVVAGLITLSGSGRVERRGGLPPGSADRGFTTTTDLDSLAREIDLTLGIDASSTSLGI
jgi:phosphoribosylglycinamide formyltransferase 1